MILKPKLSLLALFGVSLVLVLGLVSVSHCHQNDDQAEQELHRCQLRCVRPLQPFRRQAVCQDQCVQQYRERKEREREQGSSDDPQRELESCQRQCQEQESGQRQQHQCQTRCQEEYKEQRKEQEQREERERGNPQAEDPQRHYEKCQEQCRRQEQGGRHQQQCKKRCQEQYEEQSREQEEREQRERGGRSGNPQAEDPRQRLEQCQEQCRRQRPGHIQQERCQRRCQEEYDEQRREEEEREQHERSQERGQGSGNPEVEDPRQRYEQCQQQCRRQERGQRQQQEWCQRRCREEYEEQQREQEEREQHGGGGGGRDHHEPEQVYRQCQQRCERQQQREQRQCQERCERQYKEQKQEQREKGGEHGEDVNPQREEQEENNPYFFKAQRFQSRFRTQEGHVRVLEKFSKRSELLRGIENYRLAILEASPNTFVAPHHFDAETIFVILRVNAPYMVLHSITDTRPFFVIGNGTISLVQQNRRESFNMQRGDSIRVPSGTTVYLINRDNNEKLHAVKLLKPVNNPGQFEPYFGAGGEDPESFYRAFSNEILESALNTPRDRLDRLFGQQRRGVIVRASQEQIKALSQHASSSRGRGESRGPFSLFNEQPIYSNEFGQFFEASPNDHEQLKDLDVSVAFMSINQGGMIAPYYNTKSTRLVLVVEGSGRFEMACPELASQSQGSQGRREQETGERGAHYQKVGSRLSSGDAFVIPAGHPIAIVASQNENLQLVGFGINAQNNQKNFLAGKAHLTNCVHL
ncbi:hypothetical protein RJ639_029000 [Escallonia herrerae]|uniref:Cupin type-1 domain-containing protein n=1 Tax=Escallonia herrerae TaxID=1293975 RepID=A0AA88X6S0_9ASTE|nr:hypothetical protein RJ639_029000 [Escallonia herrerae]